MSTSNSQAANLLVVFCKIWPVTLKPEVSLLRFFYKKLNITGQLMGRTAEKLSTDTVTVSVTILIAWTRLCISLPPPSAQCFT